MINMLLLFSWLLPANQEKVHWQKRLHCQHENRYSWTAHGARTGYQHRMDYGH